VDWVIVAAINPNYITGDVKFSLNFSISKVDKLFPGAILFLYFSADTAQI
jgi:hypothetical protein